MHQIEIQITVSDFLRIQSRRYWSNCTIYWNNTEIAAFSNKKSLETGKWVSLSNGKTIFIRLFNQELEVWDGQNELVSGLNSGESNYNELAGFLNAVKGSPFEFSVTKGLWGVKIK